MTELNGVILINKPYGVSSTSIISKIKQLDHIYKIGHAGTLDPFATGLLICCINKATRLSRFFLHNDKKYIGKLRLGTDTDTQDSTGKIIKKTKYENIKIKDIFKTFLSFNGQKYQSPPHYSAVKHKGNPLYKLARKGIFITKPPRPIIIYSISITHINIPDIYFKLHCSAGTYIRTICADIGKKLKCGGHLKSLHRRTCGNFSIKQSLNLKHLKTLTNNNKLSESIISMTESLNSMPYFIANKSLIKKIHNGIKLKFFDFTNFDIKHNAIINNFIKILDCNKNLIAIVKNDKNSSSYNYCCVFPKHDDN